MKVAVTRRVPGGSRIVVQGLTGGGAGGKFLLMEVLYMTEKGQVTVPAASRERRKLGYRSTLTFFESASGDMILRPAKPNPDLDLIDHLRRFKGIDIPQRRHSAARRV